MNKALRQELWLAVEAGMKTDATVAEKAYAVSTLSDVVMESIDAVGPKRAARLFRAMVEKAAAMYPSDREDTLDDVAELLLEMERQRQQLN
jgi:hypothetical protein